MKCDVSDLKVKGITDECGIKNFEIRTPSGEIFIALREGKKYTIGDDPTKRTLRECKLAVANDTVVFFADRCTKVVPDAEVGEDPISNHSAWDCVHPCALLIKLSVTKFKYEDEIKRTLDAFGWIKPDGTPDFEHADSDYEQWRKKNANKCHEQGPRERG